MLELTKDEWDAVINKTYELEFDWIAIDKLDQVAVFFSCNQGYIADKAKLSFELYNRLFSLIDSLPGITEAKSVIKIGGNSGHWQKLSRKGLFAFDYQDIHRTSKLNQYDLISKPAVPLKSSQISGIDQCLDIIPRFNLIFESDISFQKLQEFEYK